MAGVPGLIMAGHPLGIATPCGNCPTEYHAIAPAGLSPRASPRWEPDPAQAPTAGLGLLVKGFGEQVMPPGAEPV